MAMALMLAISCAVIPVSAAEAPELSKFAGQDKRVHLVVVGLDGISQEHDFTVAIPSGATVEQETQLTNAAARGFSNLPSARYAGTDLISQRGPFTLAGSGSAQVVGGGTLRTSYRILYVELYNIGISYASTFNIRVEGGGESNVYTSGSVRGEGSYLFMLAGNSYGAGKLHLDQGATLQVWSSANGGRLDVGNIYVSCSK